MFFDVDLDQLIVGVSLLMTRDVHLARVWTFRIYCVKVCSVTLDVDSEEHPDSVTPVEL